MRLLRRILSGLTIFLACTTLVALFLIASALRPPTPEAGVAHATDSDIDPPSIGARLLGQLSALPSQIGGRRLVAVIVENQETARLHHRGLADALFIAEFPVEGFITRFAVVFDDAALPASVGPVRSLRPYFLDALVPWAHVWIHAGGSPQAFDRLAGLPDVTAVNGLALSDSTHRDRDIPAPHNFFFSNTQIRNQLPAESFRTSWPPYAVSTAANGDSAKSIAIDFSSSTHDVTYTYDLWTKRFTRLNGATKSEARPRNVLIIEAPVERIEEYGRLVIPMEGKGTALLFRSGTLQRGRWEKRSEKDPLTFVDENGRSLKFASGLTWMTAVPDISRVTWK